jgi:glycosyltransferase involved in cell wall biosynthesis
MTTGPDEPTSCVWMDVTMLAGCATQPTGISRVLLAILDEWRKGLIRDLRLCRLDMAANGFVEVPLSILDRFQEPPEPHAETPPSGWRLLKHRARQALHRSVGWLPASAKRLMKRSLKGTIRGLRFALQTSRRWLQAPAPAPTPLALGPRDLVVWLGEGWDVPGRSALCWHLKRQHGFRIAWLIHDLIPIWYPQFFGPGLDEIYAHWLVDTLWTADLILANSENTRADVRRFCLRGGIPTPPVEVIRYGENLPAAGTARVPKQLDLSIEPFVAVPKEGTDTANTRSQSPLSESFVLCVGSVEVRKNHLLLYHVWRKLIEKFGPGQVPTLVIAGREGFLAGDTLYQVRHDPLTNDHIRFVQKCSDAELRWLYQNCLFTMYPSFYEGWGLPVAESLNFGKYCIASGVSSVPEIGGDLVGYHDPYSVPECLARVSAALQPGYRQAREEQIQRQYRRREWSECAQQTAEVLAAAFGSEILGEVTGPRLAERRA